MSSPDAVTLAPNPYPAEPGGATGSCPSHWTAYARPADPGQCSN
ncbi:hypothetical protein O3Q52_07705 [Streptomyces sp. ActVer]|nr:hypothetical protein [Streptomyces sp. ActVer]MCZ4508087.1 hypothetical protein [Streptomyces sp. ActVer]